jgi:glycosyltransferase involved in cell wall biosynthesis
VNIVFVSHCNFHGNSALHVYSIASELHRRGLSPAIAVPEHAETVRDIGHPAFPVLSFDDVRKGRLRFPDGRPADLVHAFTPRELVRKLTMEIVRDQHCSYVVHLEDNEEAIVSVELGVVSFAELRRLPAPLLDSLIGPGQSHPLYAPRFIDQSAGVTVVVDRLLELKPGHLPGTVIRPGFDEIVLSPGRSRDDVRHELGLDPEELALVYPGSVHKTNLAEMRSLYLAVALLRRDGYPVVLVKTGLNWEDMSQLPALHDGIRDLGRVPRARVPELLAAGDILVQPGRPGPYSDYRFPSKLPEFLASGRPVVLPRANLGLQLQDESEALVLERGDAAEIYEKVARLATDPELRARIGDAGLSFALRELRWPAGVDRVESLYRDILSLERRPNARPVSTAPDPLLKLIALAPREPSNEEGRFGRTCGIHGYCFTLNPDLEWLEAARQRNVPFCFRCTSEHAIDQAELAQAILIAFSDPRYIRVGSRPLLLVDDTTASERWRSLAGPEVELHLALVQSAIQESPIAFGFDSAVECLVPSESTGFDLLMGKRLRFQLPDYPWFRSVPLADEPEAQTNYPAWLRKLVLQTLLRSPVQVPLLFVQAPDFSKSEALRNEWLAQVRLGVRDGIRQYYASEQLDVSAAEAEEILQIV